MTLGVRTVWCAYAVLLACAILPVLTTDVPPLFDYPNHLARMHVLAEGGDRFYQVVWRPLPNLAEDLIVPPLAALMPLEAAAKLFLVLCLAMLAAGPLLLARIVLGGWTAWSLGGMLILYSRTLLWGFLNYLFGLGIAFVGIACWLAIPAKFRWLRLAAGWSIAICCYLCHIEAFGCYALMLLGFEAIPVMQGRDWRRALTTLSQFILPASLLLTSHLGSAGGGDWHYANFLRKGDLLFSVFDNYHRPIDVACFALLLLLLAGLIATRSIRANRRGLVALGLIFAAYLLLPSQLMSGSGADHRLPPAMFLLFFGVTRPNLSLRDSLFVASGLVLVFVARMALVEQVWRRADDTYRADLRLIDRLPQGASIAIGYPDRALNMVPIPETHLPLMAVVRREDFVPTLFAYATQQPVRLRQPYAAAARLQPGDLWAMFADGAPHPAQRAALAGYDFVILLDNRPDDGVADPCLQLMGGTATFRLYKVVAAACRAGQGS